MMRRNTLIILGLLFLFGLPLSLVIVQRSQDSRGRAAFTVAPDPSSVTQYPFGKAAELTANNVLLARPLLPGSVFTFETWVQLRPFTGNQPESRAIFSQASKNGDSMSLLVTGEAGTSGAIMLRVQQQGKRVLAIPATAELSTDTWHHIVVVKSPAAFTLFLDGILIAEKPFTEVLQFDPQSILSIGGVITQPEATPVDVLHGAIDDIRISEIVRYENNTLSPSIPFVSDAQTLALWHFDGDTVDSSSHIESIQFAGGVRFRDSLVGVVVLPTIATSEVKAITFLNPQVGQIPYHKIIPIAVEVTGSSVEALTIAVDGKVLCTLSAEPYVCNWSVGPAGIAHTLEARTQDLVGNINSTTISVTPQ